MSQSLSASIAIIGAGFTGTLLAVHLLRQARSPLAITLFERRGRFGRGLAYSTGNPSHLLNVRVANMSAYPDDPDHFLNWLVEREDVTASRRAPPSGYAFVPRGLYGGYLEDQLADAMRAAPTGITCRTVVGDVHALTKGESGYTVHWAKGDTLAADRVALCLGHFPPRLPCPEVVGEPSPPRILLDPWNDEVLARIPRDSSVLILGAGLTMVDVVTSLLDQGHRGPITALSRRGLLPQRHSEARPYGDFMKYRWGMPTTALGALRILRAEVRAAARQGYNWRSVVDSVRPYVQRMWQALPPAERQRFLRHARPYWDTHRHRTAPGVSQRIAEARDRDRLLIRAGRLLRIVNEHDRVVTTHRVRAGDRVATLTSDVLINCAGPESDFRLIRDPLVRDLLDQGLIRPDPLALGIDTTVASQAIGADGRPNPALLALGPIARGAFWEMTAVPELRSHCASVAARLAVELAEGHTEALPAARVPAAP